MQAPLSHESAPSSSPFSRRRECRGKSGERFVAHRVCGTAFRRRRTLETIRELRAENVDGALVSSDKLSVGSCASGVLIDGSVLDKQMRVPEVERTVLRQLVLAANRQPQAIVVGQPCGSVSIVDRSLVKREAHLDRPGIVIAMNCTDANTPGVLKVLRSVAQRSARIKVNPQLFDFRPAGASHVGKQGPAWVQAMLHGD